MTLCIIIFLVVFFIGFGVMVYRVGPPLHGSLLAILIWAVVCTLWPITLILSIIVELKHKP